MSVDETSERDGAEPVCTRQTCPKFSVQKYLDELRKFLPYVPPIPVETLKSLRDAGDFKGMVRLIKRTMNVEVDLRIVWVSQADGRVGPTEAAPAWISLPGEMPTYGSEPFRKLRLDVYLRRSFLEESTFDQVAIAISHELSHVVLESIKHPLRGCEKAVDFTAMLLGFSALYASGAYTEKREYDRIVPHKLGYLSVEELQLAYQMLSGRKAKRPLPLRQRESLEKAVAVAAIFLLILVLGTLVPWLAGPHSSPVHVAHVPPDRLTSYTLRPEAPKPTLGERTYTPTGKPSAFRNMEESNSDPTRCCGLW